MKVSVAMITYNHENFIAKAIDSVLMQITNFDYEIVIGEDCSLDNTRNILIDYQKKHPDKIRLILNEKNLGMYKNFVQTHKACSGNYLALLEGDDYWTDPHKLQIQVDFLDSHPECSSCFNNSLIIHEDGSEEPKSYRPAQREYSIVEDLLLDNFIPTSAVMFRRGLFGKVPDWIGTLKMGDWPIHILNAHHGKIGYIDKIMAVYVVHRGGVWSTKDFQSHSLAIIQMFEALEENLEPKYNKMINMILRWRYFELARLYENIDDLGNARSASAKAFAKHLSIIGHQFKLSEHNNSISTVAIPAHINSVDSIMLLRVFLRIFVVPELRTNAPPLYKFLKTFSRIFKIGL